MDMVLSRESDGKVLETEIVKFGTFGTEKRMSTWNKLATGLAA
jgi:hypothetical protein